MQHQMPNFNYLPANSSNNRVPSIEAEGEIIHMIGRLDEFYRTFGYTLDTAKKGILPEEFIWEEYINKPAFSPCMQMHIIEYLVANSDTYAMKYGNQFQGWIEAHKNVRTERGVACAACRMKPFCEGQI